MVAIPSFSTFIFMTQHSISFIFAFKEHQKWDFKALRKVKIQLFFLRQPWWCIQKEFLLKTITITVELQVLERSPLVISPYKLIAEKKLELWPLFSESSPALKNFWLRAYLPYSIKTSSIFTNIFNLKRLSQRRSQVFFIFS